MADLYIKRGSTFTAVTTYTPPAGGLPNLIGATVTSQIKDSEGTLHDLDCTLDGTGLVITSTADFAQVEEWAAGSAQWDIRVEIGGVCIYTDTAIFPVKPQVTIKKA